MKGFGERSAAAVVMVITLAAAAVMPAEEEKRRDGAPEGRIIVESRPEKISVYRSGPALVEERVRVPAEGRVVLRLPSLAVIPSLEVRLRGSRPAAFSVQEEKVETSSEQGRRKVVTGYFVDLPSGGENPDEVTVRYALRGINWTPGLEAEVIAGETLSLTLMGVINGTHPGFQDCDVTLASESGPLGGSIYFDPRYRGTPAGIRPPGSETAYELGKLDIPAGATTIVTILSAEVPLQWRYLWDTRTRERVRRLAVISNPFRKPICPAPYRIRKRGLLMAEGKADWADPGQTLNLAAGYETGITVTRSIVTEDQSGVNTPRFRHYVDFSLKNETGREALVELVFGKKESARRKATEYFFTREPDRRPGEIFIWDMRLHGSGEEALAFSFESARARYEEYRIYESALYGD